MHPAWLLRPILAPFFNHHYNLSLEGTFPSPPFLLIANHTHTFDPLFIHVFLKQPISWVVAKGNFTRPIIGPLFKSLKFIPKQKGEPDIGTIRGILKNLKDGNIVGIFPEGSVTWDGNFQEVPKGTDKLLEMVKTPIVAVKIKGGYLSNPRWANYGRKGKIILEVKQFDGKDALEFITHNEWDWQEKAKIKFKGNNRASGIERILWFCPKCHSHRTIKSKGNIGYCKNCGEKFYVSELGYINDEKVINILDLQKQILNTNFKNIQKIKHVKVSIREKSNNNKLKLYIEGSLLINEKGIEIKNKFLEFSKIKGITTFLKRITEFIYDNKYVVRIKTENDSLLLYYLMRRYKDVYWNN